jgi:hypothetical protein
MRPIMNSIRFRTMLEETAMGRIWNTPFLELPPTMARLESSINNQLFPLEPPAAGTGRFPIRQESP